jgi:hypothetical protein
MYYSYVEIEYVATSFSPARTDLALKLLMPVYSFEECVQKAASRFSGGAGPCGVEVDMLKNWFLRHGVQSEHLSEVMATWVDWLSNGSPPYAVYHAVNTVCTVALDKTPGVCPLEIGEC